MQWETQLTQLFTESTTTHNPALVPTGPLLSLQSSPLLMPYLTVVNLRA